jgi:hypothetical protein
MSEHPDRLGALVDSWQERSADYVRQAQKLDDEGKPMEALRLGTYALQWNLAAKELSNTLVELAADQLDEPLREATRELLRPRHLKAVPE